MGIINDLTDGFRRLQQLNKELSDAEFKEEILAQKELLLTSKAEILELREQVQRQSTEYARLEKFLEERRALVEDDGLKYDKNEHGQPSGMPYCSACEKKDHLLIKVVQYGPRYDQTKCPVCGFEYGSAARRRDK